MTDPNLERFRLLRKDKERALCLHTDHWRSPGLYLSDTCLAVHLIPRNDPNAKDGEAKDDLRTLLRGLGQRLLEFNLWRPVVGVLETSVREYQNWSKDQEWHRGDFLLWIEASENVEERLADLLDPGATLPMLQQETSEPPNPQWFRKRLNEFLQDEPLEEIVAPLIDTILPPPSQSEPKQKSAAKEAIDDGFNAWERNALAEADDLAQGGNP